VPNNLLEEAIQMTTLFAPSERSAEGWQAIIAVRDIPSANVGAPRNATVAARMGAGLNMTSAATIRHALRVLASETGLQAGANIGSYSAFVLGDATQDANTFDLAFCHEVERCRRARVLGAARWTNGFLQPPNRRLR
jgi:hypothetical protein